ncbi:hypothetical protein [Actinomadura fibrosa]|uniref:Uncharacterized protein n=1 Tax=Actinomadura fibrosa TaxID=111802 RepID=A0ABW2XIR7_9ACTN|nr:hypothetical protein [Actinomadura fibrosa]
MSGTDPRRRHGPTGLLVALFVAAGLVFSYGLGHVPQARLCTEHAVRAPAAAVAALHQRTPGAATPSAGGPAAHGSPGHGSAAHESAAPSAHGLSAPSASGSAGSSLGAPVKPPHGPSHACLCLAVLFALLLLGLLAGGAGRAVRRLPARSGWTLVPPSGGTASFAPPPLLQVLRL